MERYAQLENLMILQLAAMRSIIVGLKDPCELDWPIEQLQTLASLVKTNYLPHWEAHKLENGVLNPVPPTSEDTFEEIQETHSHLIPENI